MELDDLKAGWNVLNERLEQNEILNKRIIKEMITNRTQSAYERLFRFDLFGLVTVILLCILLPVMMVNQIEIKPFSIVLLEGALLIGLVAQFFLFSILVRFNMEKMKLCDLSRLTLRYKLWTKRSYTYGTALAFIVIVVFFFIQEAYLLRGAAVRMTAALLLASFIAYYQIRFYKKNIQIVEKGIEELDEFEKE